jgi:signal transduction histidine kinase
VTRTSRWPGRKPRILAVLLAVNLVLLALPLGGLWSLRLYDSALLRQTEAELVAQAAVIGAAYRAAWPAPPDTQPERWTPRFPVLDLARDPVFPPPPDAAEGGAPDPRALSAGEAVRPLLGEAQRITLAAMRVTDAAGIVVASSGEELGRSLAAREEVAAALAGRAAAVLRERAEPVRAPPGSISRSGGLRVFVAMPVVAGGAVVGAIVLSRTPTGVDQALRETGWKLLGLAATLVLAATIIALVVAYTVGRPIRAVAAQAQAVAAGAPVALTRTRTSAVREADELFDAIAGMAATLERRADYIRGFATEVSHEFKTPLSALRGALELLQDHAAAMTGEERARFLAQAAGDVDRLERLVRRLLELARAEAPAPAEGSCEIGAVARDAAAPFLAVGMVLVLGGPDIRAAIASESLRAVISLLLENVRQHAGQGARCDLTWRAEEGEAVLTVADDGRGVSAGNAARIFDRFFTTAREAGGTGLGLSIARGRVEAAGGRIALRPSPRGAAFEIRLRLAA